MIRPNILFFKLIQVTVKIKVVVIKYSSRLTRLAAFNLFSYQLFNLSLALNIHHNSRKRSVIFLSNFQHSNYYLRLDHVFGY